MTARRGKIARLPRAVREELNLRMEDGEAGGPLAEWLNGLEEVRGVLKEYFGGRAITEHNLSDWRMGGYVDWQQQQETFELANGIMEAAADRKGLVTEGRLSDHVGDMAALALARMLRAMTRMEEGKEQWETTIKIVREVVRLRQSDRAYEDALRRQENHARYEGGAEHRSRAEFERDQERLDQLIMHKLVENGRGRLEDIPAPSWAAGRGRRTENGGSASAKATADARRVGDGGQRTESGGRREVGGAAPGPAVGQGASPKQPLHSGSGAGARPESQSTQVAKSAQADKLAEPGGLAEAGKSA